MKKLLLGFSIFFSCINDKDINDKKSDLQNNSNFTDVSILELLARTSGF